MNAHPTQKEILLVTTTTLFRKQLCTKEAAESNTNLSAIEQIEAACWNGLLDELLPELIVKPVYGGKLFIWHIGHGASCLQIQMGEFPVSVEKSFSLDPSFFLPILLVGS